MKREEFEHVREDVRNALLEAPRHDPQVTTDVLFRLLDMVGEVAIGNGYGVPDGPMPLPVWSGRLGWSCTDARVWATCLLEDVQTRVVGRIPYGETQDAEPPVPPDWEPEDHRD